MEGYCGDEVIVLSPSNKEAWTKFQSVARWKQWGVNAEDSFGSVDNSAADEADISCETMMDEYEMDCQEDEQEISGVPGGTSDSTNCWAAFFNNQEVRLDGFPRIIQTDENFVNTMFLDDVRVGEQYQRNYSSENKFMKRSDEHFEPPMPLTLFDWDKESDVSHQNLSNLINNDVPRHSSSPGNSEIFISAEETALQEFGKAMDKMTDNTRLCLRDALYRLASNSVKHSAVQGQDGDDDDCALEKPSTFLLDQSLRSADKSDKHTSFSINKAIDVTIADLMFSKAYQQYVDDCHQEPDSTHGSPKHLSPKQP